MPGYIEPSLAEKRDFPASGDAWVHEIKFDGYRLQLHKKDLQTRCFTRRGHDWSERFPTVTSAAWKLPVSSVILDGEAVIVTDKGDTDFAELESYVSSK